ncbi:Pvc16 family protein [Streptomyces sp. NBC_01102]|uniref:Pvc16 family protein n=1 Tax=Streptomyces sp. NBC_01102 TaxID=2903749 RepID=UPI003862E745|nr:Pvc16 family protein [Streptomyces sp. NBC_01102]
MSNALAVATVTQALALLIESNLGPEMDIAVKVETRKPPSEPPSEPTVTVFLYQVTPNPAMRNNNLPTRAADGTLRNRAAAPLDLHYVISAYGEETELVGQRLLGCVIRTLHEIPVLPRELIELAAERPHLAGSDLADSLQKVRFTPTVMDVDETSKLWGMLHQTPYTLSVAYQASLVVIEGREKPVPAKPVEQRTVRVVPFAAPGAPVPPGADKSDGDAGVVEASPVPVASAAPTKEAPTKEAPTKEAPAKKAPAKQTAKAPAKPTKAAAKRTAPPRPRRATTSDTPTPDDKG